MTGIKYVPANWNPVRACAREAVVGCQKGACGDRSKEDIAVEGTVELLLVMLYGAVLAAIKSMLSLQVKSCS